MTETRTTLSKSEGHKLVAVFQRPQAQPRGLGGDELVGALMIHKVGCVHPAHVARPLADNTAALQVRYSAGGEEGA